MLTVKDSKEKRRVKPKFDTPHLVANSAIASVGAGVAMGAATGLLMPALAAAAVGAVVGYSATDQIPRNGD